jgi:hypothetical protein
MAERDEDGFLERWSRRKRREPVPDAQKSETETETESAAGLSQSAPRSEPRSGEDSDAGDPEVIAKLPDLDSLTEKTDFTAFLQDGVPEALRRQALRRLWRLNPVFANLDGMNEYDEDFSAGGIIAQNIKTIYKAGKGYLDEDETETEDEPGDEPRGELAADEDAEDAVGAAESGPDPNPGDSAGVSRATPGSDSGPPAEGSLETESEKPARGSALARRWGGSPDKG